MSARDSNSKRNQSPHSDSASSCMLIQNYPITIKILIYWVRQNSDGIRSPQQSNDAQKSPLCMFIAF